MHHGGAGDKTDLPAHLARAPAYFNIFDMEEITFIKTAHSFKTRTIGHEASSRHRLHLYRMTWQRICFAVNRMQTRNNLQNRYKTDERR